MNLTVQVSNQDHLHEIRLAGEIDVYTAPKLKEALLKLTNKEGAVVKIDLEKVTYMDSTGLGVLIGGLKASKQYGSEIILINLQERVYRLFDITGLKEVFTIENTIRGGK